MWTDYFFLLLFGFFLNSISFDDDYSHLYHRTRFFTAHSQCTPHTHIWVHEYYSHMNVFDASGGSRNQLSLARAKQKIWSKFGSVIVWPRKTNWFFFSYGDAVENEWMEIEMYGNHTHEHFHKQQFSFEWFGSLQTAHNHSTSTRTLFCMRSIQYNQINHSHKFSILNWMRQ